MLTKPWTNISFMAGFGRRCEPEGIFEDIYILNVKLSGLRVLIETHIKIREIVPFIFLMISFHNPGIFGNWLKLEQLFESMEYMC